MFGRISKLYLKVKIGLSIEERYEHGIKEEPIINKGFIVGAVTTYYTLDRLTGKTWFSSRCGAKAKKKELMAK